MEEIHEAYLLSSGGFALAYMAIIGGARGWLTVVRRREVRHVPGRRPSKLTISSWDRGGRSSIRYARLSIFSRGRRRGMRGRFGGCSIHGSIEASRGMILGD